MSADSWDQLANIVTVVGAVGLIAAGAALFHQIRASHAQRGFALYIPNANGGPGDTAFQFKGPYELIVEGVEVDVFVARGRLENAGPSPAFNVRVFGRGNSEQAHRAISDPSAVGDAWRHELFDALVRLGGVVEHETISWGRGSSPVLRADGDVLPFIVIGCYSRGSVKPGPINSDDGGATWRRWDTIEGRMIHPVNACAFTVAGKWRRQTPNELCAPYWDREEATRDYTLRLK